MYFRHATGINARTHTFALYLALVSDVFSGHGIRHHQYADDTQLFFALKATMHYQH